MATKHTVTIASVTVATIVAIAVFLRPARTSNPELPSPGHIPADVRAAIRDKMQRHGGDMRDLLMYLVVLDNDGVARTAGRVFDEPILVLPTGDQGLTRFLPKRFFALQDQLKAEAKLIVAAGARRDSAGLVEHFGTLTKTCVTCHQAYLYEEPPG